MSLAILKKKSKRYKLGCGVSGHGHNGSLLMGDIEIKVGSDRVLEEDISQEHHTVD